MINEIAKEACDRSYKSHSIRFNKSAFKTISLLLLVSLRPPQAPLIIYDDIGGA